LRGDGANFRSDGNILRVGGGPSQTHGFPFWMEVRSALMEAVGFTATGAGGGGGGGGAIASCRRQ